MNIKEISDTLRSICPQHMTVVQAEKSVTVRPRNDTLPALKITVQPLELIVERGTRRNPVSDRQSFTKIAAVIEAAQQTLNNWS